MLNLGFLLPILECIYIGGVEIACTASSLRGYIKGKSSEVADQKHVLL
jgi:hypothetical protein